MQNVAQDITKRNSLVYIRAYLTAKGPLFKGLKSFYNMEKCSKTLSLSEPDNVIIMSQH